MQVGFEIAMVGASLWALTRGGRALTRPAEALLHALCITLGAGAFAYFFAQSTAISANGYNAATQNAAQRAKAGHVDVEDDIDDDLASMDAMAANRFARGRTENDRLVQVGHSFGQCLYVGLGVGTQMK